MIKSYKYILFFLMMSCSFVSKGVTRNDFLSFNLNGVPYRLFIPENYTTSSKYPLVLHLHGAGVMGTNNESQLDRWAMTFAQDSIQKKYPSFVLVPQTNAGWANGSRGYTYTMYSSITSKLSTVLDIIDNLREEYRIDSTRLYITGLSMGGFGTWDLICRKPDMFAAAIPICGGGDTTYADVLKNIPLRVFHGSNDVTVPARYSRQMDEALLRAKAPDYLYTEYPGVAHESWEKAYVEPWLSDWLFSHRKYFYDDEIPPSKPNGLVAKDITCTSFVLQWNSSTDNVDVSSYNVYLEGELYYSGSDTTVSFGELTQGTSYSVTVVAVDENDNLSLESDELVVPTLTASDTEAPSKPLGLTLVRAGQTNFEIKWDASTDNVKVVAYDVYLNNERFVSTENNTLLVNGVTSYTHFSVYVVAKDSVNNYSEHSDTIDVTTFEGCVATIDWTNTPLSEAKDGTFTVEFDATPKGDNMDGLIGLSSGDVSAYSNYSCIFRFFIDGTVDAYNLGASTGYSAENEFLYYANETYHVRMVINVSTNKYSVYISREGEQEVTIGSDYNFRASASSLNNIAFYSTSCTFSVENITVDGISITGINEVEANDGFLYPNPADDKIMIRVAERSSVNVFKSSGELVMNEIVDKGITELPINLSPGIYLVELSVTESQSFWEKLIVK